MGEGKGRVWECLGGGGGGGVEVGEEEMVG